MSDAAEGDTASSSTSLYMSLHVYRIFTDLPRKGMLFCSITIFNEDASRSDPVH